MSLNSQHLFLNNEPRMTRPTLIDVNLGKCCQGLRYHPFIVNFDNCDGRIP